jgi:hypothetical protein
MLDTSERRTMEDWCREDTCMMPAHWGHHCLPDKHYVRTCSAAPFSIYGVRCTTSHLTFCTALHSSAVALSVSLRLLVSNTVADGCSSFRGSRGYRCNKEQGMGYARDAGLRVYARSGDDDRFWTEYLILRGRAKGCGDLQVQVVV